MLNKVGDIPLVEYVYRHISMSKQADIKAVITSTDKSDDELFAYCKLAEIPVFRGTLDNVLKRYVDAAKHYDASIVCRVCGDTPFADIALIDLMFRSLEDKRVDYIAPHRSTCAAGFFSEVISSNALERSLRMAAVKEDLEHVTKYILGNTDKFSVDLINARLNPEVLNELRFTMDYPEDADIVGKIAEELSGNYDFTSDDVIKAIKKIKGQTDVRHSRI